MVDKNIEELIAENETLSVSYAVVEGERPMETLTIRGEANLQDKDQQQKRTHPAVDPKRAD